MQSMCLVNHEQAFLADLTVQYIASTASAEIDLDSCLVT